MQLDAHPRDASAQAQADGRKFSLIRADLTGGLNVAEYRSAAHRSLGPWNRAHGTFMRHFN